jgi:hypothetical protein
MRVENSSLRRLELKVVGNEKVWKMSNAWILAPIVVIDVHFYFNLAAILE